MRISFTVMVCHSCIVLLLALSIAMEIPAWINDRLWNQMLRNETKRFTLNDLKKCTHTLMNGTVTVPGEKDYAKIFQAKTRDLPFENLFLVFSGISFLLYLITSMIYLCLKRTHANIYLALAVNFLGMFLNSGAFCFILSSTVMYSEKFRKYLGSEVCYNFVCHNCPEDDNEYEDRARHLFYQARDCMEKLHVCQANWLKDRIVYLLLGCVMASTIAFGSSICRLRRHAKRNAVQPKKISFNSEDLSLIPHPSMKDTKENSVPDITLNNQLISTE